MSRNGCARVQEKRLLDDVTSGFLYCLGLGGLLEMVVVWQDLHEEVQLQGLCLEEWADKIIGRIEG